MNQQLTLSAIFGASQDASDEVVPQFATRKEVKKGDIIQKFKHPIYQLIFVEKGLFATYKMYGRAKRVQWLSPEGKFINLTKRGLSSGILTSIEVKALEDGIIWCASASTMDTLLESYPAINEEYEAVTRDEMLQIGEELELAAAKCGVEWYEYVKRTAPSLLTRVPRADLASYMMMSESELSHIMKSRNVGLNGLTRRFGPKGGGGGRNKGRNSEEWEDWD